MEEIDTEILDFIHRKGTANVRRHIAIAIRGRPKKWDWPALMRLWVVTRLEAYAFRYSHPRAATRQLGIKPTIEKVFANKRSRQAFLDRVCPVGKNVLDDPMSAVRRYYEADRLMQRMRRTDPRIHALYIRTLENVVEAFKRGSTRRDALREGYDVVL